MKKLARSKELHIIGNTALFSEADTYHIFEPIPRDWGLEKIVNHLNNADADIPANNIKLVSKEEWLKRLG